MLSSAERLRASEDFRRCVARGQRSGGSTVVLYGLCDGTPFRAGFIVSKKVGNAVVRNRTKRRLRHLTRAAQASSPLPDGSFVVVRALPGAATTPELATDFSRHWRKLRTRLEQG